MHSLELWSLPLCGPLIAGLVEIFSVNSVQSMDGILIRHCGFHIEQAKKKVLEHLDGSSIRAVREVRFIENYGLVKGDGGVEFIDAMLGTRVLRGASAVYIVSGKEKSS